MRILVMSHSHPRITNGGAEIAAFKLFSELNDNPEVDAWFLGCNTQPGGGRDGVALTQPFTDREYIYSPDGQFNWFRFSNGDARLPMELKDLLVELQPDIIHLHHYVNFGVETFWIIKKALPRSIIVVTLHEYLAICNHFGQMVKRGHFSLCDQASYEACHKCFPDTAISDFFIRDRYIKLFFDQVTHFVSPSNFLLERYVAWGISSSRLSLIENITASAIAPIEIDRREGDQQQPLRIGFFGQISRLKGIGVLLECASILSKTTDVRIVFEIYGDYSGQPSDFQDEFLQQLKSVSLNVNYRGAYRQDQVDQLMLGVDAVIVPSIWWENSPVVIQEALRNRRPIICSNIGGMAEKVRDGIDGFHFPVGSGLELSYVLDRIYYDRNCLNDMQNTIQKPPTSHSVLADHLALYGRLRKESLREVGCS